MYAATEKQLLDRFSPRCTRLEGLKIFLKINLLIGQQTPECCILFYNTNGSDGVDQTWDPYKMSVIAYLKNSRIVVRIL